MGNLTIPSVSAGVVPASTPETRAVPAQPGSSTANDQLTLAGSTPSNTSDNLVMFCLANAQNPNPPAGNQIAPLTNGEILDIDNAIGGTLMRAPNLNAPDLQAHYQRLTAQQRNLIRNFVRNILNQNHQNLVNQFGPLNHDNRITIYDAVIVMSGYYQNRIQQGIGNRQANLRIANALSRFLENYYAGNLN